MNVLINILGIFTDANNRVAIESILGIVFLVTALVFIFNNPTQVASYSAIAGTGLVCLGLYTAGNAVIDKSQK
jgi:hypothetical protein